MSVKLDFEKAYDRVDWEFLQYMLRQMGFGVNWQRWTNACVSSARSFISINGVSQGFLPSRKGFMAGAGSGFVLVGEALAEIIGCGINELN